MKRYGFLFGSVVQKYDRNVALHWWWKTASSSRIPFSQKILNSLLNDKTAKTLSINNRQSDFSLFLETIAATEVRHGSNFNFFTIKDWYLTAIGAWGSSAPIVRVPTHHCD
jgi:hypothetical protein